jgi:ubiquinone/menaquinone biosynthesis C-methylase UbiE
MDDAPHGDTADRSLRHWSEAGRRTMDAFYELATQDYRELVAAHDWPAALREQAEGGRVRLLDVACGSGKFPSALLAGGLADEVGDLTVEVDLLDPSPFSIAEARAVLCAPFAPADELEIGLEELEVTRGPYDVAWATHALYAVPPALLADGLARMHAVLRPGGLGVVAQATSRSHYLAVYEAYRASHAPEATPYTTAEQVTDGLRAAGADVRVRDVRYRTGTADAQIAEGFLQRCLFDDAISLEAMTAPGPNGSELATYLDGCRDGDAWTFTHHVHLITWHPS